MSAELLINVTPSETRVALIENGALQEMFVERAKKRGLVGSIYKGRVSRVLPGMQSAFVDIGLQRAAFLHASDVVRPASSPAAADRESAPCSLPSDHGDWTSARGVHAVQPEENITELLREQQEVLVQVIKDPLGSKGARLTTQISIPSCYLVFMPDSSAIGVTQRIEDEQERQRLRDIVRDNISESSPSARDNDLHAPYGGFIIRTAAEHSAQQTLAADMRFLCKLWNSIRDRAREQRAPAIIHEDLPLAIRTMREFVGTNLERVRIDSEEMFEQVLEFCRHFIPEMVCRIEHYTGERPIFDLHGIEDEIQRALQRKVQLKSGGHLVIDQTEAMTTIDVNTGAYVGNRNLEETIFTTNLEATHTITRQLRLRNLGGIIIIDFIDMTNEEHKRQVLRSLDKSLERDHTKTKISEVSSLGLVQMTRKRTRESLAHVLCEPCPTCGGRGEIKTPDTVCYEIFREILRGARQYEAGKLLVLASQEVIDTLVDEESASFAELETFIGKPIKLQVEALYTQEQFDVVLM